MAVRTTAILVLFGISALACSRSKERAHDAPPTSTVETRSAPLPISTSTSPTESPSKPIKKWMSGTVALGDTGLTVTLPEGFEIAEGSVKGFWDVEGVYEYVGPIPHRGTVAGIMASFSKVPKASSAIKDVCGEDRRSLSTLPLGKGGLFVKCSGESKLMSIPGQKIITHKVRSFVPSDAPSSTSASIECYYEADNPALIAVTEKVCRSIRSLR
jgi:hypothetical protein